MGAAGTVSQPFFHPGAASRGFTVTAGWSHALKLREPKRTLDSVTPICDIAHIQAYNFVLHCCVNQHTPFCSYGGSL